MNAWTTRKPNWRSWAREDGEILNAVFRLFHSVKGSAGFLGFEAIKTLTHEAEALLEVFIKEKIPYTQDALDVVYRTIDVLREMVRAVEAEFTDEGCSERALAQTEALRALIGFLRDPSASGAASPAVDDNNIVQLNELVTQDMVERFLAESADLIEHVERDALDLEFSADRAETIHSMFRAVHTIKGNAGFFSYSPLEIRCVELEQLLDGARKGSVVLNEAFVNGVLARIDRIRTLMASVVLQAESGAAPGPPVPLRPRQRPLTLNSPRLPRGSTTSPSGRSWWRWERLRRRMSASPWRPRRSPSASCWWNPEPSSPRMWRRPWRCSARWPETILCRKTSSVVTSGWTRRSWTSSSTWSAN
jgi:chemotaxis protein histidine kinase CheA